MQQLIAGIFDARLRVEELSFGLRDQLLRPQHIELRHDAGVQLGLGRVAQLAGAIQTLPGDGDEGFL